MLFIEDFTNRLVNGGLSLCQCRMYIVDPWNRLICACTGSVGIIPGETVQQNRLSANY